MFEKLFNCDNSTTIRIYLAKETIIDPYEKNVEITLLNPIPIKAIVVDLTATQASYKMPGIKVSRVKEVITYKKYRSLIEQSHKIEIDSEDYEGWRENGRMQIREEHEIIRIYVYSKHV